MELDIVMLNFRQLPNNGTASDVAGIVSATIFKNTVNDSKIVTPEARRASESSDDRKRRRRRIMKNEIASAHSEFSFSLRKTKRERSFAKSFHKQTQQLYLMITFHPNPGAT